MKILGLIDEDFVNYKKPCMIIEMPYCSFKCDKENGNQICQNGLLANAAKIDIDIQKIITRYLYNDISRAICFQGLEPFDSKDFEECINSFRKSTLDPIIIYTGYTEHEVLEFYPWIYNYKNIIIKYGRFIPDSKSHFDEILGVNLVSDNQYAKEYNVV